MDRKLFAGSMFAGLGLFFLSGVHAYVSCNPPEPGMCGLIDVIFDFAIAFPLIIFGSIGLLMKKPEHADSVNRGQNNAEQVQIYTPRGPLSGIAAFFLTIVLIFIELATVDLSFLPKLAVMIFTVWFIIHYYRRGGF